MRNSITGTLLALILLVGGSYYIYIGPATSSVRSSAAAAISGIGSARAPGFAASSSDQTHPVSVATAPIGGPRTPPAGYTEYRSKKYRFSVFYPTDLTVSQYDEGGGAETVRFQNVSTVQGFQIFILPYGGSQIPQERFRLDAPSGVMQKSPENVAIDGVPATSFYNTDPTLSDTAEVWFLHGGYLYEVTTFKSEAVWLSDIMGSWKFI
jgi:hypothetical protein